MFLFKPVSGHEAYWQTWKYQDEFPDQLTLALRYAISAERCELSIWKWGGSFVTACWKLLAHCWRLGCGKRGHPWDGAAVGVVVPLIRQPSRWSLLWVCLGDLAGLGGSAGRWGGKKRQPRQGVSATKGDGVRGSKQGVFGVLGMCSETQSDETQCSAEGWNCSKVPKKTWGWLTSKELFFGQCNFLWNS